MAAARVAGLGGGEGGRMQGGATIEVAHEQVLRCRRTGRCRHALCVVLHLDGCLVVSKDRSAKFGGMALFF